MGDEKEEEEVEEVVSQGGCIHIGLIYGPPGSGKSTIANDFPFVFDLDQIGNWKDNNFLTDLEELDQIIASNEFRLFTGISDNIDEVINRTGISCCLFRSPLELTNEYASRQTEPFISWSYDEKEKKAHDFINDSYSMAAKYAVPILSMYDVIKWLEEIESYL
jgi:hypothetical protein